jgi:DNA modification methylase
MIKLLHGDCLGQMKTLPDNSVDSIVTDPPYGISFMAKKWDYDVPKVEVWKEAMRILKPGGHALIACGTRTQHRMVVNIEDAGFEIRDVVSWIYGSGFPKSLNISKAIDKAAGSPQSTTYEPNYKNNDFGKGMGGGKTDTTSKPITTEAKQWDGWGTALKPSCEFFTLCRKPLSEKTIAKNVLKWGTGGINVDECRVGAEVRTNQEGMSRFNNYRHGDKKYPCEAPATEVTGRFPANLIHDGSQEVLDLFPGANKDSAARFFYCPKASKKDRNEGNNHPTVKPTALMAYLCRLITPTGGVVLDPYMGSGSTGKAAVKEGFSFVGCELDGDYFEIAKARIDNES